MTTLPAPQRRPTTRNRRTPQQRPVARPCDLTYNSSVDSACKSAGFESYESCLDEPTQWRYVYGSSAFINWLSNEVPKVTPSHEENERADIQISMELTNFIDGKCLAYGSDIRCLELIENGVWELKTPDLRIFGWFPHKNYFIAHFGIEKSNLKKFSDYKPYLDIVIKYRASLSVPLSCYIAGAKIQNVVSNRSRSV